jgi:hypothetical protein
MTRTIAAIGRPRQKKRPKRMPTIPASSVEASPELPPPLPLNSASARVTNSPRTAATPFSFWERNASVARPAALPVVEPARNLPPTTTA